ncbi:hypothetical protein FOL47_001085 [Perkinsus chesapeaki]|uniref:Calmodulin n=1 Tax=Perkinsus chesapeaki TaxID=330153 RepID=A0A7J6MJZ9_PERCH|nr:hypothetical protein FOL47_001085 [Perkinsus chesapeaki]
MNAVKEDSDGPTITVTEGGDASVDFGSCLPDTLHSARVMVTNAIAVRTAFIVKPKHAAGSSPFEVRLEEGGGIVDVVHPCPIDPSGSVSIVVSYKSSTILETVSAAFEISTVGLIKNILNLTASAKCETIPVKLNAESLSLGEIEVGKSSSRIFTITNESPVATRYQVILNDCSDMGNSVEYSVFKIDHARGVLEANSTATVMVTARPKMPINYYKRLWVVVRYVAKPLHVDCIVNGFDGIEHPMKLTFAHVKLWRAITATGEVFPVTDEMPALPPTIGLDNDSVVADLWSEFAAPARQLSESSIVFGGCLPHNNSVHRRTVTVRNGSPGKITVSWPTAGLAAATKPAFIIRPEICEIGGDDSQEFTIEYRPAEDYRYSVATLDCVMVPKENRSYRIGDAAMLVPTHTSVLTVTAHTWPAGAGGQPKVTVNSDTAQHTIVKFRTITVGETDAQVVALYNWSGFVVGYNARWVPETTVLTSTDDLTTVAFGCFPPIGSIEPQGFALITVLYRPRDDGIEPGVAMETSGKFKLMLNDQQDAAVTLEVTGKCWSGSPIQLGEPSQEIITLPPCSKGSFSSVSVDISNPSGISLKWTLNIPKAHRNLFSLPTTMGQLPSYGRSTVMVTYHPTAESSGKDIGWVHATSVPVGGGKACKRRWKLVGISQDPVIRCEPSVVDLGPIPTLCRISAAVQIRNCSSVVVHYTTRVTLLAHEPSLGDPIACPSHLTTTCSIRPTDAQGCLCPGAIEAVVFSVKTAIRGKYQFRIDFLPIRGSGEDELASIWPIGSVTVTANCQTPVVQVMDLRVVSDNRRDIDDVENGGEGPASCRPVSAIWQHLMIDDFNVALKSPLNDTEKDMIEREGKGGIGPDKMDVLLSALDDTITLNLGTGAIGTSTLTIYAAFVNVSDIPVDIRFITPRDTHLEGSSIPLWAYAHLDGDGMELARHHKWVMDEHILDVRPRHCMIEPGKLLHVKFTYRLAHIGMHVLPIVLQIGYGKRLRLLLTGNTLPRGLPRLSVRKERIVLEPVAIGGAMSNGAIGTCGGACEQTIELSNFGGGAAPWRICVKDIEDFNKSNYHFKVLDIRPTSGLLAPNGTTFLHVFFCPIEPKDYHIQLHVELLNGVPEDESSAVVEDLTFDLILPAFDPRKPRSDNSSSATLIFSPNLPSRSLAPVHTYGASLLMEHIDFGNVSAEYFIYRAGSITHRLTYLSNRTQDMVMHYRWDLRGLLRGCDADDTSIRGGQMIISPEEGLLLPGTIKPVIFTLNVPTGIAGLAIDGEAQCTITSWTAIEELERSLCQSEGPEVTAEDSSLCEEEEIIAEHKDHRHEPAYSKRDPFKPKHVSVVNRLTVSRFRHLASTAAGQKFLNENLSRSMMLSADLPSEARIDDLHQQLIRSMLLTSDSRDLRSIARRAAAEESLSDDKGVISALTSVADEKVEGGSRMASSYGMDQKPSRCPLHLRVTIRSSIDTRCDDDELIKADDDTPMPALDCTKDAQKVIEDLIRQVLAEEGLSTLITTQVDSKPLTALSDRPPVPRPSAARKVANGDDYWKVPSWDIDENGKLYVMRSQSYSVPPGLEVDGEIDELLTEALSGSEQVGWYDSVLLLKNGETNKMKKVEEMAETAGLEKVVGEPVKRAQGPKGWPELSNVSLKIMNISLNGNNTIRSLGDNGVDSQTSKSDLYIKRFEGFNQDGKGCPVAQLGHLLRLCGFSPTRAMLDAFEAEIGRSEDARVSSQQFLAFCSRCVDHLRQNNPHDLKSFFAPMDPEDTGVISIKAFRSVMENAGDAFTREEVDIFVNDFSKDGIVVDYRAMIDTGQSWVDRSRVIAEGGRVEEYLRVVLRYDQDIYIRLCGTEEVYSAELKACVRCPPRCFNSRHIEPRIEGVKCICDRNSPSLWNLTLDDLSEQQRNARMPHRLDTVFADVRDPTVHALNETNATIAHYSRGVWTVIGLPIQLTCTNHTEEDDIAEAMIRRFGHLAPPVSELVMIVEWKTAKIPSDTLWWTLRPRTSFGVDESIDSMLTQMAMVQQPGVIALLIPTRIIHHRSVSTPGFMSSDDIIRRCSISFPNDGLISADRGGAFLSSVDLRSLEDRTSSAAGSCGIDSVQRVIDQIDAVKLMMKEAGRLSQSCTDHSKEYPYSEPVIAGSTVTEERSLRIGILKYLSTYNVKLASQLAEDLVIPHFEELSSSTPFCKRDPIVDAESYYGDPCCNAAILHEKPCQSRAAVTGLSSQPWKINVTLAAMSCLKDDTGSASYVRKALQVGSTVVHRQLFSGIGDDCDARIKRDLLIESRVHSSIESCMESVYGRYNRRVHMRVGSACTKDSDCSASGQCLISTRREDRYRTAWRDAHEGGMKRDPNSRRVGSGYCRVLSGKAALVALLQCLERDWSPLITRNIAIELGMGLNITVDSVAEELMSSVGIKGKCVGPKTPLESYDDDFNAGKDTAEKCIMRSPKTCNWNINIISRDFCETNYDTDTSSCRPFDEQWAYQQSSPSVCMPVSERSDQHCWEAFDKLVETTEEMCLNEATTTEQAAACEARRMLHTQWLTECTTTVCDIVEALGGSESGSGFVSTSLIDQHCTVTNRNTAMLCMDSCRETSGPQPLAARECYRPMDPTETEDDCLRSIEGDVQVHYRVDDGVEVPTSGMVLETDELMRSPHPQPAFCTVRSFVKGRKSARLVDIEAQMQKRWEAVALWKEQAKQGKLMAQAEQYDFSQPRLEDDIGDSPSDILQKALSESCHAQCACDCASCMINGTDTFTFECSSAAKLLRKPGDSSPSCTPCQVCCIDQCLPDCLLDRGQSHLSTGASAAVEYDPEVFQPHVVQSTVDCKNLLIDADTAYDTRVPWTASSDASYKNIERMKCLHQRNTCIHNIGSREDILLGSQSAVDPVVAYEICEREVLAGTVNPDTRRMQQIWRSRTYPFTEITDFGKTLLGLTNDNYVGGTFLNWDITMNYGKGGCYYRLPDPLQTFGGPNRATKPYLSSIQSQVYADLFSGQGIASQGWPSEFSAASQEFVEYNLTPPASANPQLVAQYEAWKSRYQNLACRSTDSMTFYMSRPSRHWSQGFRTTSRSCSFPVCNVDHGVRDEELCAEKSGCLGAECPYCKSDNLPTEPDGICLDYQPSSETECHEKQGGIWIEGSLFNVTSGKVDQTPPGEGVCALPHRPLVYCVGPLQTIRRCADFEPYSTCEVDEVAKLMKCRSAHRQCQDPVSCGLSGRCSSSRSLNLREGGAPGRCIIPRLDFDLLRLVCHKALGVCFFPIHESPWGLVVVDMAEVSADLLTPGAETAGIHSRLGRGNYDPSLFNYTLSRTGKLDRQRCQEVGEEIGMSPLWVESSWTRQACEALQGCCMMKRRGDSSACELFSGKILDASNSTALVFERARCLETADEEELIEGLEEAQRSYGTNMIKVETIPREEALTLAPNLLALPGRYAFAMAKLSRISPTASPTPPQATKLPGFTKVGSDSYPEAFIQFMIRMANPELFTTTTMSPEQKAEEESLSKLYAGMKSEDPRLYLTYEFNESSIHDSEGLIGNPVPFTNSSSCWSSVSNSQGRAVGQVVGDCVHLQFARPLAAPVELCLPIAPPEIVPRNTTAFDTMDFGVLRTAQRFGLIEATDGFITPDSTYGLLRPGDRWIRALGKQLTKATDTYICALVMEQHRTYCPIMRMNDSMHVWPADEIVFAEDTPSAETSCNEIDTILDNVHRTQFAGEDISYKELGSLRTTSDDKSPT